MELEYKNEIKQKIADCIDVSVIVIDENDNKIVIANDKLTKDLKINLEEIAGKTIDEVFYGEFKRVLNLIIKKHHGEKEITQLYYWGERGVWGKISTKRFKTFDGKEYICVSMMDISDIGKSELQYQRLTYYDMHLDIPNGIKLEKDIEELGSYENTAIINFKINNYNSLADLYGWETVEYLLIQIKEWMIDTAHTEFQLYRIGDVDFCVLVRNVTYQEARNRANEIIERFKEPWKSKTQLNSLPLFCTISVGLVFGRYITKDIRNLLYRTLQASQKSKKLISYDSNMDKQIKDSFLLRQSLISCVQQDMKGFSVYYQPVINARTEIWEGMESLCRWHSPEIGWVSPQVFISYLEQLDLIDILDNWVMEQALKACKKWSLDKAEFFLDVNMSPAQILDDSYVNNLLDALERYDFPPEKLNLEITESNKFDFSGSNLKYLSILSDKGIKISLDDFGTGYSSFNNLAKLPAKILKTEKSFIDNIESDSYLQYLLKTIVDMAHFTDKRIIAEGVERNSQKELLVRYGVDYLQGYFYSRPLSHEEMDRNIYNFRHH